MNWKDIEREFEEGFVEANGDLSIDPKSKLDKKDLLEWIKESIRFAMESVVVEGSNLNTEAQSDNEMFNKIKERLIGYNQARQDTLNNIDRFFN